MDIRDFNFVLHRQGENSVTFMPSGLDDSADPEYYGFVADNGAWVIMQKSSATKIIKYCFGKSDFETNWSNRGSLTYRWYNEAIDPDNFA